MNARITKNYYLPSGFESGDTISIIPNMQADANDVCNAPIGMCYLCKREDGALGYVPAISLQLFDEVNGSINWEQRRYEIAKDVLAAQISDAESAENNSEQVLAKFAVIYADALIEELKNERENEL